MKITLSLAEITAMVTSRFALPPSTEVEIAELPMSPDYAKALGLVSEIKKMAYTSHEKIRAIKYFREIVPSGLVEAKWAIENFLLVEDYVNKNRRVPGFKQHSSWNEIGLV